MRYKENMTEQEAEEIYKEEISKGEINTIETPHYIGFNEFLEMLKDMGVKIK